MYIVAIHFGINLIVSGVPLIDVAATKPNNSISSSIEEIIEENTNTTSNGTHKDL